MNLLLLLVSVTMWCVACSSPTSVTAKRIYKSISKVCPPAVFRKQQENGKEASGHKAAVQAPSRLCSSVHTSYQHCLPKNKNRSCPHTQVLGALLRRHMAPYRWFPLLPSCTRTLFPVWPLPPGKTERQTDRPMSPLQLSSLLCPLVRFPWSLTLTSPSNTESDSFSMCPRSTVLTDYI